MFEAARKLVLTDRDKAKRALAAAIKRQQAEQIEVQLDQIAEEERERKEREASERARADAVAAASGELVKVRTRQHQQAKKFDQAMHQAGAAFEELEALANQASRLERTVGVGTGNRPLVVGHARTSAIIAAVWDAARPLAKRLRLSAVPGSRKNIRPLANLYAKPKEKK